MEALWNLVVGVLCLQVARRGVCGEGEVYILESRAKRCLPVIPGPLLLQRLREDCNNKGELLFHSLVPRFAGFECLGYGGDIYWEQQVVSLGSKNRVSTN